MGSKNNNVICYFELDRYAVTTTTNTVRTLGDISSKEEEEGKEEEEKVKAVVIGVPGAVFLTAYLKTSLFNANQIKVQSSLVPHPPHPPPQSRSLPCFSIPPLPSPYSNSPCPHISSHALLPLSLPLSFSVPS